VKTSDVTPVIDLIAELGTGPSRERRPVYVDLLPPCNHACPAGENIQGWLAEARAGRHHAAWQILVEDNPLPAVHGRVCYHPCESDCNREQLDSAVSIHAVERFLGDMAVREGWTLPQPAPSSGKRVLIVGAGPSGLSAGYHLARLGHTVEIHDAGPLPGGMMHFGIPAYRLPREELMREVRRIEELGVKIVLDHKVDDLVAEKDAGRFDAVFAAIGADVARRIDIPARDAARVVDAVSFLHGVSSGERPSLGRRVVVYGGGNTAMDAARTAKRLGAEETLVVYHRDRAHMAARDFEADEALEEGIKIKWLTSIKEIAGSSLTVEVVELGPDGTPQPTGRFETIEADAVVLALGQQTDSGFLKKVAGIECRPDGTVVVGPNMMTGHAGIFAGGDMVPSDRTITSAVGHGKKAARAIDAWLRGSTDTPAPKHPVASFEKLHLPVYSDAERREAPRLAAAERTAGFAEVVAGLTEAQATYEAQRCLSCGNCFECDQCFAGCPEKAIEKLGPGQGYRYRYERCTGCAICSEGCPVHAIEMIPEPAAAG
jgi:NADPH-dependent glutamate synthase beta subunit-like oxidoreductase